MLRSTASLALVALGAVTAVAQRPPLPLAPPPGGRPAVIVQQPRVGAAVDAQAVASDLLSLPANAAVVVRVNVPAVLKDRSVARLLAVAGKAGPDAISQALAGFVPNPLTIDRVTTAVVFQPPKDGQNRPPEEGLTAVVIVHTSQPFDPIQARLCLLGEGSKEADGNQAKPVGARAVYVAAKGENGLAFPDAQTLVYGPAELVVSALGAPAGAGSAITRELLNPPGGETPVQIAAVRASMPAKLLEQLVPPELAAIARAETMAMTFSPPAAVGADAAVNVRFTYATDAAATQARQTVSVLAAEARAKLAEGRALALKRLAGKPDRPATRSAEELPEAVSAVLALAAVNAADEWVRDLPIARDGAVLATTIAVPSELAPALIAGPAALGFALPAVQKVRGAAARTQTQNSLKQIGLAMHSFHDTMGAFPAAAITSKDGKPLLSWRVAVLPYIEQDALYKQFKLDEPWDSDNNKKLIALMPRLYMDPRHEAPAGQTYFKVFTGKKTVFDGPKGKAMLTISDGTSNTILAAVGGDAVTWTKPEDNPFDPDKPLVDLSKPSPTELLVLIADGSVRVVRLGNKPKADTDKLLKLLIQPDDGSIITGFDD